MHISSIKNVSGTNTNRNLVLLHHFAIRLLFYTGGFEDNKINQIKGVDSRDEDDSKIVRVIESFGSNKEINDYFDKYAESFGDFILSLNERTKEHSTKELLNEFKELNKIRP